MLVAGVSGYGTPGVETTPLNGVAPSQAMNLRRSVQSGPVAPRLARGLQTASELTLPSNTGCGIPYCCKPSK